MVHLVAWLSTLHVLCHGFFMFCLMQLLSVRSLFVFCTTTYTFDGAARRRGDDAIDRPGAPGGQGNERQLARRNVRLKRQMRRLMRLMRRLMADDETFSTWQQGLY